MSGKEDVAFLIECVNVNTDILSRHIKPDGIERDTFREAELGTKV